MLACPVDMGWALAEMCRIQFEKAAAEDLDPASPHVFLVRDAELNSKIDIFRSSPLLADLFLLRLPPGEGRAKGIAAQFSTSKV